MAAILDLPGAFGVHMPAFRVPNSLYKDNRARLVARFVAEQPAAAAAGCVCLFRGKHGLFPSWVGIWGD